MSGAVARCRWLAALALVVGSGRAARADNYFAETHYDLGLLSMQDVGFDGGMSSGVGLHLDEHNGVISRMPYVLVMLFAAVQLGGDSHVQVDVTTGYNSRDVEFKDAAGRVTDRTTIVSEKKSISMTVTPLTAEEKKARDATLDSLGTTLGAAATMPSHFELLYVPQRDNGKLHGLRGALYPLAAGIGRHFELAIGYAGAHFTADTMDPSTGAMRTMRYRLRSVAARIGIAPARWFVLTAEIQPNLLDLDDSDGRYGMTARATAALSIPTVDRIYAKLGTERMGFGESGRWSTFFEGGLRF
jgi:hypothetical protein